MVVSGTHSLDMSLWLIEGLEPVSIFALSSDKVLSKDATFGVFTMNLSAARGEIVQLPLAFAELRG